MFAKGSAFQQSWCEELKASRVVECPWSIGSTAEGGGSPVATREVSLCTPPPAAWGYLVGSMPIPSRRKMSALRVRAGSEVLVEETTTLDMPFGNTFHTCVQYYLTAVNDAKTHLRVTFKLTFTRFAAMKGVLTTMVRGEHEKIFSGWQRSLLAAASGAPAKVATLVRAASLPRGDAPDQPPTPVGVLVAHAPEFAAIFAAGCLAGAALAIVCAAILQSLPATRATEPLQRYGRLAEAAASGAYPNGGLFLVAVGRAILFARLQPLALALALLILILGTFALVRMSGVDHLVLRDTRRQSDDGGDDGMPQSSRSSRGSQQQGSNVRAALGSNSRSGASTNGGGSTGAPAGHRRPLASEGTSVEEIASTDDGAAEAQAEETQTVTEHADAPLPAAPTPSPKPSPAPRPPPGPVDAPPEQPMSLAKGVQRLLSKAGRDDAVADVTEVFSVLANDFLGKSRGNRVASPDAAVLPPPTAPVEDDRWAVDALHLEEDETRGAAVEWVFEHSRYMPTLGWSFEYLLPTDRRRWSQHDTAASTDALRELISLPSGWRWADVWQKDMRGAQTGAVDSQGWSYAVDFPFLHSPPLPGDGRESTLRCVRRRRWVRVRVPVQAPQASAAASVSEHVAETPLSPPVSSPLTAEVTQQTTGDEQQHSGWEVDLTELSPVDEEVDAVNLLDMLQRVQRTVEQESGTVGANELVAALQAFLSSQDAAQNRESVPPAPASQPSEGSPRRLSFDESMWALKADAARVSGVTAVPQRAPTDASPTADASLTQTAQVSTPERHAVWSRSQAAAAAPTPSPVTRERVVGFEGPGLLLLV